LFAQTTHLIYRFFEIDASAKTVFSFGKDTELNDDFFKSDRLIKHAKYFVQMIERAIGLLGPDIELLTDVLLQLGEKHAGFGVKASHFPPMGDALLKTVEELLGDKYTTEVKESWLEVYQALSYDMIRARNHQRRKSYA
jgi:hemoglobin-like flavoprotein